MTNITSSSPNFIRDILERVENWNQFEERAASLGNMQKGQLFEHLVKHYLELDPKYQSKLEKVWLFADVPHDVLQRDHRIYPEARKRTIGTKVGKITRTGWDWSKGS